MAKKYILIILQITILLLGNILTNVYASVNKTYKDEMYHFRIDFPSNYLVKESKTGDSFLRVTAASQKRQELIAVYALKTREDGYNFKKAMNILLSWRTNIDEINKDKFIEYFEKEIVKETSGSTTKSMNEKKIEGVSIVDKEYKSEKGKGKIRYITKNNYAYAILLYSKNGSFSQDSYKIVDSFSYSIPSLNIFEQLTVITMGIVIILIVSVIYYFTVVLFWYVGLLGIWAILKGAAGIIYILLT